MVNKIKTFFTVHNYRHWLDIRNIGLAVFAVLVMWVTWSGSQTIQLNYQLQKKISKLEQQNEVQKLANDNLKLRNEYFKTDEFLELAARRQFGKAAPGELVIIIPKEVAMQYAGGAKIPQPQKAKAPVNRPWYQSNFEAWLDFFFHRRLQSAG